MEIISSSRKNKRRLSISPKTSINIKKEAFDFKSLFKCDKIMLRLIRRKR